MPGNTAVIQYYEKMGFVNRGSRLMSQVISA